MDDTIRRQEGGSCEKGQQIHQHQAVIFNLQGTGTVPVGKEGGADQLTARHRRRQA